ncbi:hypothetical protein ACFJGV_17595 [Cnuibacter sp. UC19_7]|uniref:hypothetical protein n=1 Tax=Cnuibacter sp. UC19_7 TaxID=3350166 RepID=UPI00366E9D2D
MSDGGTSAPGADNSIVADQIRTLFDALEITHVVAVDDYYPNAVVDLGALTLAVERSEIPLGEFTAMPGVPWTGSSIDTAEQAAELLRESWDSLDPDQRDQLAALKIAAEPVPTTADERPPAQEQDADAATISNFREFFPSEIEVSTLSATAWDEQRDMILAGDGTVLVFFDLDLRHEDRSSTAGADLLRELQQRTDASVIAGILTHEASSSETEQQLVERLRSQHALKPFPLMGKDRAKDPVQFLDGLRTYLILAQVIHHTTTIADSIRDGVAAATAALASLDAYDFITTMQNARYEGVYELDGPLRIANRALRRETVAALGRNVDHKTMLVLRSAATIMIPLDASRADAEHAQRWEHDYDDAAYVNGNHLPLEVGDVFKVQADDASETYYVLLMQPCDLSLREDGKRSTSLKQFTLARLRPAPNTIDSETRADRPEIPAPIIDDRTPWEVNLADLLHVPEDVLDLVVFSDEGDALMNSSNLTAVALQSSWTQRGRALEKRRRNFLTEAKKLDNSFGRMGKQQVEKLTEKINRNELGLVSPKLQASIDQDAEEVRFNLRRVGRLTTPIAHKVLTSAGQRQYRPALEYDLFGDGWRS